MNALGIIPAVLLPVAAGFPVAALMLRGRRTPLFELLALAFGAGTGLLTITMFLLGLASVPFSLFTVTPALFIVPVLCAVISVRRAPSDYSAAASCHEKITGWRLWLWMGLLAWVFVKAAFVLYEGLTLPMSAWDDWAHWASGAKFFYYAGGLSLNRASEHFFASGYRFIGHPIHSPLLQVWASLWTGEFSEVWAKAFSPFYFVSMLAVLYGAVRRHAGPFTAAIGVFVLSGVPLLTYHGIEGYSDMLLGFYALAAVACFWRFIREGGPGALVLAGFFAAMCAMTKNEGLFFFAAILFALAVYLIVEKRRPIAEGLYFVLPFVAALPWLAFKAANGFGFGHGSMESSHITWLSDPKAASAPAAVHWEVLPVIWRELFLGSNYGLIFAFFAVFSLWHSKRIVRGDIRYLYIVLFSVMAAFGFVYLTMEVTAVSEFTGLHRNVLSYLPILVLSACLLDWRAVCFDSGGA